ncbi:MAG: SEC-C metal-binding domain-containing protein, partial [Actinomycetota bacterium]|nr:SEC-C metal-binding domain-containing protein [Actinomycetota bacterium]
NLRAMGQKDPLTEWRREGFDMFGQMMEAIADDFVRYVMHLDVVVEQLPAPAVTNVQYSAPEDPVQGTGSVRQAAAREAVAEGDGQGQAAAPVDEAPTTAPVVKGEHEKLGRNQPCWCGSGKKFKLCHGR